MALLDIYFYIGRINFDGFVVVESTSNNDFFPHLDVVFVLKGIESVFIDQVPVEAKDDFRFHYA